MGPIQGGEQAAVPGVTKVEMSHHQHRGQAADQRNAQPQVEHVCRDGDCLRLAGDMAEAQSYWQTHAQALRCR